MILSRPSPVQFFASTLATAAILCTSCRSDELPVHPVRGRVMVDGQPAELALVVLHPSEVAEHLQQLRPRGTTDSDGYFSLMTYWHDDGAPVGQYRVTVVWPGPPPKGDPDSFHPDELSSRRDLLEGQYSDPKTSKLQVTVTEGSNQLAPLRLNGPQHKE